MKEKYFGLENQSQLCPWTTKPTNNEQKTNQCLSTKSSESKLVQIQGGQNVISSFPENLLPGNLHSEEALCLFSWQLSFYTLVEAATCLNFAFTMNLLKEFWMMIFFCQHGAKSLLGISLRGAEQRKQLTHLLGKSLGRKEQVTTFTRADGYFSAGVSPRWVKQ